MELKGVRKYNRVSGEWMEDMFAIRSPLAEVRIEINNYKAKTSGHAKKAVYLCIIDRMIEHFGPEIISWIDTLPKDWDRAIEIIADKIKG
jgi:hypothetical protein